MSEPSAGAGHVVRTVRRKIGLLAGDFRADERNRKFVAITANGVLPAALAIVCATLPNLWAVSGLLAIALPLVIAAAQAVCLWLALSKPETTGPLLLELANAESEITSRDAELGVLRPSLARLARAQNYALATTSLAAKAADPAVGPAEVFERVLGPLAGDMQGFFAFDAQDVWTIAAYLLDPDEGELRCVWRRTDPRHAARTATPRSWRPGEGHVGQAFARADGGAGLITADSLAPDIRGLLEAKGDKFRAYDKDIYRSFASFAFGRPTTPFAPLGVIIATSSRVGAWSEDIALPLRQAAATLTVLHASLDPMRPGFVWPSTDQLA